MFQLNSQTVGEGKYSPPPPYSIQVLSGLDDAQPHWGGQCTLFSLPIQMLIASVNLLTITPRNNV